MKFNIPDRIPPIDEVAVRKLHRKGLSGAEIARRLGYSPLSMRNFLRRANLKLVRADPPMNAPHRSQVYTVWKRMKKNARKLQKHSKGRRAGTGGVWDSAWDKFSGFYRWAMRSGFVPGMVLYFSGRGNCYKPSNCQWIGRGENRERLNAKGSGRKQPTSFRHYDTQKIIKMHTEKGMTPTEIARRIRGRMTSIRHLLIRNGVYERRKPEVPVNRTSNLLRGVYKFTRRHCENPKDPAYQYYGAKGIRVCREWREFKDFYEWAMSSGYKKGVCLSRKDRLKDYTPKNCIWVTRARAAKASRHLNVKGRPRWLVPAFGELKGPTQWSRDRRCSVSLRTLILRLRGKWEPEEAIETPAMHDSKAPDKIIISAFDERKSVSNWSRDPRCKVTLVSLVRRLRRGLSPKLAITSPPFQVPEIKNSRAANPQRRSK